MEAPVGFLGYVWSVVVLEPLEAVVVPRVLVVVSKVVVAVPVELQRILILAGAMGEEVDVVNQPQVLLIGLAVEVAVLEGMAAMAVLEGITPLAAVPAPPAPVAEGEGVPPAIILP
jgi:hypothetical protein